MPKKTPAFSVKPLDKPKTTKASVKSKKKPAKKSVNQPDAHPEISDKPEMISKKIENRMDKQLSSIYTDSSGNMPNMKKIKVRKTHPIVRFFLSLIVVTGLLVAIVLAGKIFILPDGAKFSEEKVTLTIQGPQELTLAATTTYLISYANNQSTQLNNAVLTVQYPDGFSFYSSLPVAKNTGNTEWELGTIQPNEKKIVSITGLTYGAAQQAESWRVFLTYKPEKYNYQAQKVATLKVELQKTPFSVSAVGPDKATVGNDIEYKFKIKNDDKTEMGQLQVEPSWTSNFFIATSTPALNSDSRWTIDTNTTTYEWDFVVKGRFVSTTEKKATAKIKLIAPFEKNDSQNYELAKSEISTELEQNTLNLSLAVNGKINDFSAQPGDNLVYTINLKNTSKEELNDVKIELEIDSPSAFNRSLMDWGNLKDEYDGDIIGTQLSAVERRGEITWHKSLVPKLSSLIPTDEVSINVTLPIRDINQFNLTQLKNHEIKINTQAIYKDKDGKNKLITSNPIKITINSDLELEVRDTKAISGNLENHEIKWILTNNFHELENVKLEADVYGDSTWTLDGQAPAGTASFDSKAKKITWTIDKMPLTVDTLALPFTVSINSPSPSQELLVSKVKLTAQDTVTKQKIEISGDTIRLK